MNRKKPTTTNRRWSRGIEGVVLGLALWIPSVRAGEEDLRTKVWEALRETDDAGFEEELKEILARPDATPARVEEAVRRGPDFPDGVPKGKLRTIRVNSRYGRGALEITAEVAVNCEHVNYASTYFLYVPTTYDPSKPHPLYMIFSGGSWDKTVSEGRSIAFSYLRPWIGQAEKHGVIVAAPVITRGWGLVGRSLTRTTIWDVARKYNIDPDRVSCWGQSMGGHACWREGLQTPDDWAGISPVCGGYDRHDKQIPVLNNLAVYQVWGNTDPHSAGLGKTNRYLAECLKKEGINAVTVGKPGGHELFPEEIPNIIEFFGKNPRNLYPRNIISTNCGTPYIDRVDQKQRWTDDYIWNTPMIWSRFYWTRFLERHDESKPANWTAKIADGNRIELETENLKTLELFLHDRMVDLDKPVAVVADGKTLFEGKVERSVRTMLEEVRASRDRGRIYTVKRTLDFPDRAAAPSSTDHPEAPDMETGKRKEQ